MLPDGTDLKSYNHQYISRHSQSPTHIFGAAKGLSELQRSSETRTTSTISVLNRLCDDGVPPSVPLMLQAIQLLKDLKASSEEIDAFRNRCKGRVPLATVFDAEAVMLARRKEVVNGIEMANGVGKADL